MDPFAPLPPISAWERQEQDVPRIDRVDRHPQDQPHDDQNRRPAHHDGSEDDEDAVIVELDESTESVTGFAERRASLEDDGTHIDIEV